MEFLDSAKIIVMVNVALAALPFVAPNKVVRSTTKKLGQFLSLFLRQKIGKRSGEKIEGYFQGTLQSAMDGLNEGLDSDDGE